MWRVCARSQSSSAEHHDSRLVELAMPNPTCPEDIIEIQSLRPMAWFEETGCRAGNWMQYALPEMGLMGLAKVQSVEPCPPIEDGPGRVVLSTVTHYNSFVLRIWLEGQAEPLEPTERHRLYSVDRGDWVQAGELEVGESLRTLRGPVRIQRIDSKPGTHRVYNLEVETKHCYYVSDACVLSHNTNPCARGIPAGSDLARAIQRGMRLKTGKAGFEQVAAHLAKYSGISRARCRERIHQIKAAWGLGPADDCYFGLSGDVYHPYTGEFMNTLTGH